MSRNSLLRWALLAAVLPAAGCSHIPYLKKLVKPRYYPYLESRLFSFVYPRKWGEPAKLEYGVQLREPGGRMACSVEFLPKESKAYVPPDTYRKDMSQWGAVEDDHRVYRIEFSSRPALQVRFTTYEYDARYLLGQQVRVSKTEQIMVPDPRGLFRIAYQTPVDLFWEKRNRKEFEHFLGSLVLSYPSEPAAFSRP